MNLDDFKSDWKQGHNNLSTDRFDALASNVVERTGTLEAGIRRRDLIEAAATVVVVAFFGVFLWFVPLPVIAQVGVWIIMLGAIEAVVVMFWTRHRDDKPQNDLPLLDFCTAEIKRVDRQINLFRNVTWWYSGPILLGCCVLLLGALLALPAPLPAWQFYGFLAAFYACFLAVGIILHRGNFRAVNTGLIPFRDELAELVRSLTNDTSENSAR